MNNEGAQHLDDVKDPISKAKLEGIQQSSLAIDLEILNAQKSLDEKRGLIAASDLIAKRLFQECGPIKAAVESNQMDPAEAKIRIDVVKTNVEVVRGILDNARIDAATQRGVIDGLQRAHQVTAAKFKAEALKYERWERVQAEEAAEQQIAPVGEDEATGKSNPKPPRRNKRVSKTKAKSKRGSNRK